MKQLPPYSASLPECVKEVRQNSCLNNLLSRKAITSIPLKNSYRSHPVLTDIISKTLCDSELKSSSSVEDRRMWKELKFPKPFDDIPLMILDVPGTECRTPLQSWTNDEQNGAALKIAQKIQSHLPGRLTKLCYYNSILRDLRARKLSLPCYTVDSYMSRETDLVLLLTTRTNTGLTEKTGRFFFDQNRLIVALTKAKEGVIVLDSQRLLEKFPLWKKLFSELIKRIEIVSPEKFIGYLNR